MREIKLAAVYRCRDVAIVQGLGGQDLLVKVSLDLRQETSDSPFDGRCDVEVLLTRPRQVEPEVVQRASMSLDNALFENGLLVDLMEKLDGILEEAEGDPSIGKAPKPPVEYTRIEGTTVSCAIFTFVSTLGISFKNASAEDYAPASISVTIREGVCVAFDGGWSLNLVD